MITPSISDKTTTIFEAVWDAIPNIDLVPPVGCFCARLMDNSAREDWKLDPKPGSYYAEVNRARVCEVHRISMCPICNSEGYAQRRICNVVRSALKRLGLKKTIEFFGVSGSRFMVAGAQTFGFQTQSLERFAPRCSHDADQYRSRPYPASKQFQAERCGSTNAHVQSLHQFTASAA